MNRKSGFGFGARCEPGVLSMAAGLRFSAALHHANSASAAFRASCLLLAGLNGGGPERQSLSKRLALPTQAQRPAGKKADRICRQSRRATRRQLADFFAEDQRSAARVGARLEARSPLATLCQTAPRPCFAILSQCVHSVRGWERPCVLCQQGGDGLVRIPTCQPAFRHLRRDFSIFRASRFCLPRFPILLAKQPNRTACKHTLQIATALMPAGILPWRGTIYEVRASHLPS